MKNLSKEKVKKTSTHFQYLENKFRKQGFKSSSLFDASCIQKHIIVVYIVIFISVRLMYSRCDMLDWKKTSFFFFLNKWELHQVEFQYNA